MKKHFLILVLFLAALPQLIQAQSQGIEFAHVSFAEAKAQAAEENKLIFMDGYAVWCGPCRWMAANAFPDPEVGALFNQAFVNLKIDMEKGEGPRLAQVYRLRAYPTLFILDSEGQVLEKIEGGMSAKQLKAWAEKAIRRHRPELLAGGTADAELKIPAQESWYQAIESGDKEKMQGMTRRMFASENMEDQMAVISYWHQYAKFHEQPGLYMSTMVDLVQRKNYNHQIALNNAAWYALDLTQDEGHLLQAVAWVERAMEMGETWYSYDTFARLMLALGDVDLAREFANKALKRAREDGGEVEAVEQFIATLENN